MNIETNKIAGAVLSTLLFVVGLNVVSSGLFSPKKPAVPGYDLPAPEADAAGAPGGQAAAAQDQPLPVLLASADATKGQSAARKCSACHTFDKGGPNRVGPNLYGIIGAPKAHAQGFNYSGAMKERASKGEKWDYEEISKFIANPKGYLPGTIMAFAGIPSGAERADILAYLRTLNDNPPPLPQP